MSKIWRETDLGTFDSDDLIPDGGTGTINQRSGKTLNRADRIGMTILLGFGVISSYLFPAQPANTSHVNTIHRGPEAPLSAGDMATLANQISTSVFTRYLADTTSPQFSVYPLDDGLVMLNERVNVRAQHTGGAITTEYDISVLTKPNAFGQPDATQVAEVMVGSFVADGSGADTGTSYYFLQLQHTSLGWKVNASEGRPVNDEGGDISLHTLVQTVNGPIKVNRFYANNAVFPRQLLGLAPLVVEAAQNNVPGDYLPDANK